MRHHYFRWFAGRFRPFGKTFCDEFAEVAPTGRHFLANLFHVRASIVRRAHGFRRYVCRCARLIGGLVSGFRCRCGCRCGVLGLLCGHARGKVRVCRCGLHTGLPFGFRLVILYGLHCCRCAGCCRVGYVFAHASNLSSAMPISSRL
jgi:hypothetical protein